MSYILPVMFAALLIYGLVTKKNVYNSFIGGAKTAYETAVSLFPYLAAMFLMINLLRVSGLINYITKFLSAPLAFFGIPEELTELVIIRPFSGSGSLALLQDIFDRYGPDSYVSRCASVMMGSTETVFYVSAVYFAETKIKKTGCAVPVALFCTFIGCIATCLLCRVM